jgi:hypothetical protein
LHFYYYLSIEKDLALYFNKCKSFHPKIICTKDQYWHAGCGDFFFLKIFSVFFSQLESPPPRMIFAKSGYIWLSGSEEKYKRQTDGGQTITKVDLKFQLR